MRGIFTSFAARGAMAVALATGMVAGGLTLGATAAQAKEKAPKPGEYSKEFVAAAGPLQATIQAMDPIKKRAVAAKTPAEKTAAEAELKTAAANGPAQLAAATAAIKTPADKMAAGNWALSIGGALGDSKLQQQGIAMMLESGQVPAANQTEFKFYLGNLAYNNQDYATATTALADVVAANYTDDSAGELLADSWARAGQPAKGLDALKAAIAARTAAGSAAPENWYTRANTIAYNAKLGPQAIEWSRLYAAAYPSPLSWLSAGQMTREFTQFTNQESLDLGRLLQRAGAFNNKPEFVEREFVEYIEAASKTGVPAEVVKMANAGVAGGALQKTDPFVVDALRDGGAAAAKDKANLPADERTARASADGKAALATGDSYLSQGNAAKAEEMFQLSLTKGGADRDRALTRLGIAQVDQGKFADAKASFAQVGGSRADLAKLWWAYADGEEKAAK